MQLNYLLLQVKQRAHILNLRVNYIWRQREIGVPYFLLNAGVKFVNQRLNDLVIVLCNSTEFAEAATKQKVRYSLLRVNAVCYIGAKNAGSAERPGKLYDPALSLCCEIGRASCRERV